MKKLYLIMMVCLLATFFCACKKKNNEPDPKPDDEVVIPGYEKTPHGAPIGEKTQTIIGPAGGSIILPNNAIKLNIPPGAVEGNVAFSVQEVENTMAAGGIGKAFRLLPENVEFKKDVELSIRIKDSTGVQLFPNWMYLAYQDKHGYWHRASNSFYNDTTNTINVKTRHFSDWSLMQTFKIKNTGKDELEAGESTNLELEVVGPPKPDIDDLLSPPITLDANNISGWRLSVTGSPDLTGTLTPGGTSAKFRAPAKVSKFGSNTVYADLKGLETFRDPKRPNQGYSLRVGYNLTWNPDEYAICLYDNRSTFAMDKVLSREENGKMNFQIQRSDGSNVLHVEMPNFDLGSKPFGEKQAYVTLLIDMATYYEPVKSYYMPCNTTVYQHTPGSVKLSASRDGLIKGEINGYLRKSVTRGSCETVPIPFKATFRVRKP